MKERFEFVTLVVSLLVIGVMLGAVAVHYADHVGFLRCTTDYWRTHYERGTKPGDLPPIGCASPPPPAISTRHLPATRSSPSYSVPPGCRLFRTGLVCDRAVSDEEIEGLEEMRK